LPGLHVTDDRSASADDNVGSNLDAMRNDGAEAYEGAGAEMYVAAERCARGQSDVGIEKAIVLNHRVRIQRHVVAQACAGIDHGARKDNRTFSQRRRLRHNSSRVNHARKNEIRPARANPLDHGLPQCVVANGDTSGGWAPSVQYGIFSPDRQSKARIIGLRAMIYRRLDASASRFYGVNHALGVSARTKHEKWLRRRH